METCTWCDNATRCAGTGKHPGYCCGCSELLAAMRAEHNGSIASRLEALNKRRAKKKKGPLEYFQGALRPVQPSENEFGPVTP